MSARDAIGDRRATATASQPPAPSTSAGAAPARHRRRRRPAPRAGASRRRDRGGMAHPGQRSGCSGCTRCSRRARPWRRAPPRHLRARRAQAGRALRARRGVPAPRLRFGRYSRQGPRSAAQLPFDPGAQLFAQRAEPPSRARSQPVPDVRSHIERLRGAPQGGAALKPAGVGPPGAWNKSQRLIRSLAPKGAQ